MPVGMKMTLNEMYDALIEMGVNEETIDVVTAINGWNQQAMEDILYAKFGYRTFEQALDYID